VRRNGRMYGTGRAVYCRCSRCGRGGARCFHHGLAHKACLSPEERKEYETAMKASYKPSAFPIGPRPRTPSSNLKAEG